MTAEQLAVVPVVILGNKIDIQVTDTYMATFLPPLYALAIYANAAAACMAMRDRVHSFHCARVLLPFARLCPPLLTLSLADRPPRV
jgi:hypothetical protein